MTKQINEFKSKARKLKFEDFKELADWFEKQKQKQTK